MDKELAITIRWPVFPPLALTLSSIPCHGGRDKGAGRISVEAAFLRNTTIYVMNQSRQVRIWNTAIQIRIYVTKPHCKVILILITMEIIIVDLNMMKIIVIKMIIPVIMIIVIR